MKTILWLAQYLSTLIQILKAVEAAIPESGNGKAKLAMVREMLEMLDDGTHELWPSIEKVIAVIVKTFNQLGVFKTRELPPQ